MGPSGITDGPAPPACTHPYVRVGGATQSHDVCSTCGALVPTTRSNVRAVYRIEARPIPDDVCALRKLPTWSPPPGAPKRRGKY